MKILHTSDWHLGQTLSSHDRTEEHRAMLHQIADIVTAHKPDVFLLCGDVCHSSQPSATVQTMFAAELLKIRDANPGMKMVVTAGNHDSGSKHEIYREPWERLGVHMCGWLDNEDIFSHIIEIPDKGYVVAIPYVNERNLPDGLCQQLLDEVARRNADGLPVVMTAHTTVTGCVFEGHEDATEQSVGGIDAWSLKDLGTGYDYVALGHIHHRQWVAGSDRRVRYCGTPMALNFDEHCGHSVSIVTIDAHGSGPVLEEEELKVMRPLVTIPMDGHCSFDEAKERLKEFPADIPAYIRLRVEVKDFLPTTAMAELQEICRDKECRLCYILTQRTAESTREDFAMSVQEFQAADPMDIAARYAGHKGIVFGDDLKEMFAEVLDLIKEEDNAD